MKVKDRFQPKMPSTSSTPTTMENTTITLPKMKDWDVEIGHLWNCRKSEYTGQNIFDKVNGNFESEDYLEVVPIPDMEYKMTRVKNASDKAELLDISVEVKIDLPSFTVEGGVSFRTEDQKRFDQDEFLVQYKATTSVLRTRASVQDPLNADAILNMTIANDVKDGSTATHYVSEIRYGGWATGRFLLSDTMDHNLLDLSGSVGGTVPVFPGISVGLKASIGFMEQDTNLHFSKEIGIESSPALEPKNIQTITEMFKIVETIPTVIENALQPYPPTGSRIKGIPISFRLTPLSFLIDLDNGYESYDLLEAELLTELSDMIFNLNDLQTPNHYRNLIREQDPRLVIMFPKPGYTYKSNPWALQVDRYETSLLDMAKRLNSQATAILSLYKDGKKRAKDLRELLTEYTNSVCNPVNILVSLQEHVQQGKDILRVLRTTDASLAGEPELFVFTITEWEFLMKDNNGFSILLSSNADDEIPVGVFMKLFSIIPSLRKHVEGQSQSKKFQAKVAAPNIVDDFSLALKMNERSAYVYHGQDILDMLKLLGVVIAASSRNNTNTSRFYSIFNNNGSADSWNLSDLDNIYKNLVLGDLKTMSITCADSYLETLEALAQNSDATWTLVLPTQFIASLHDTITYYKKLMNKLLDGKLKLGFRTIVGYFDSFGDVGEAPLMIILDKEGSVVSVCFDHFDLLLLGHQIENRGSLELECLAPINMGTCPLAPFKFDNSVEICNILSDEEFKLSLSDGDPFLKDGNLELLESFQIANSLLQAAAFKSKRELVSSVCPKPVGVFKGRLVALLNKNGWDQESGFQVQGEEPEWAGILAELNLLKNELNEDTKGIKIVGGMDYLDQLIKTVDYAASGTLPKLSEVFMFYVDEFFKDAVQSGNTLHEDIKQELRESEQGKFASALLKGTRLLQLSRLNENYYAMWKLFDNLWINGEADDPAKAVKVLELIAGFENEDQIKWVWGNIKFQYWTSLFLTSKSVSAKIYQLFCKPVLPSWFPAEHRRQLLAVYDYVENPLIKCREDWDSIDTMLDVFAELIVSQKIPDNFTTILGDNITRRQELQDALRSTDSLFYWNEPDGHFTSGWGVIEITKAFKSLQVTDKGPAAMKQLATYPPTQNWSQKQAIVTVTQGTVVELNSNWSRFTGGSMQKMGINDYHKFESSYDLPLILLDEENLETAGRKIVEYFIAQIKQKNFEGCMDGSTISKIIDYVDLQPISPTSETSVANSATWSSCFRNGGRFSKNVNIPQTEEDSTKFLLTRADLLTLVFTIADQDVRNEVLLNLSENSVYLHALPWFIPDITKYNDGSLNLSPSVNMIDLSEYFKGDVVAETRLLSPPYKLITSIRVGNFENSNHGKSTVLNNSLLKSCTFSSKFEPGYQNGPPISRDGLVELAWLSEFTTKEEFFDIILKDFYGNRKREMVLLANVHGDALNQDGHLFDVLRRHSGAFLIFWGCNSWKEMLGLRPQVDEVTGDRKVYNIVIDPDQTICNNVQESMIIQTSQNDYHMKIQQLMKDILYDVNPTIDIAIKNEPKLVTFVKDNTVQTIRRSLTLQNQGLVSKPDEIRPKILKNFLDILTMSDRSESKFWAIRHLLHQLSTKSNSTASHNLKSLTEKGDKFDTDSQDFIKSAKGAALHGYNLNSLRIINLFRELNLESTDLDNNYIHGMTDIFNKGFPVEMFNQNFFSSFDQSVQACLTHLEEIGIKFVTVAIIGPQSSKKTALINQLFAPVFIEDGAVSSNGVIISLLHLNLNNRCKPLEKFDAILLLDTEAITGTTANDVGTDFNFLERQVAALILSISDLCLIACDGDSDTDGLSNLHGVMELRFLIQSSILEQVLFPDIIIIDQDVKGRQIADRNEQVLKMLGAVSNLTTKFPLQTLAKYSTIQVLQSTYTQTLSHNLQHKFPLAVTPYDGFDYFRSLNTLRSEICVRLGAVQIKPDYSWLSQATSVWQQIKNNANQFSTSNATQIQENLNFVNLLSSMRRSYEAAYSAHEGLLETANPAIEIDFSDLSGIPHFCVRLDENICKCQIEMNNLEILEAELLKTASPLRCQLVHDEVDDYTLQLRSDIMSRMTQERIAAQISKGTQDGELSKKLEEMLETDPDPWVLFKQFTSGFINVGPWECLINSEIEAEYSKDMWESSRALNFDTIIRAFEDLRVFDLRNVGRWGQSPLDISHRIEDLEDMLTWEEYIWLDIQIEREVTRGYLSYSGYGYKRGMLRYVKDQVNEILATGFKEKLPKELEFTPKFIVDVHFLAVQRFTDYWKEEWEKWVSLYDPVRLLEERKDQFPHGIFIGEDGASKFNRKNELLILT